YKPMNRFKFLSHKKQVLARGNFLGESRNGCFDWEYPARFFNEHMLEIQAEGYIPLASSPVKTSGGDHFFEFKLQKSPGLAGRVLLPDGAPAAGAEVWLSGESFGPFMGITSVHQPWLLPRDNDWNILTHTDAEGAFRFQQRSEERRVGKEGRSRETVADY